MDKDLVKKTLNELPCPTVTITAKDAGGDTHSFIGTVTAHDVNSYESKLILATDQGSIQIDYRAILEITPST